MSAKTILITDDEPHMRRLLAFALRKTGHQILQADSGEAALAKINQESIDLVIMDYTLEGMNGLDTVNRIRELPAGANLPVVLITARGDSGIREEATSAAVSAFVTKPFSPVELVALAQKLLDA